MLLSFMGLRRTNVARCEQSYHKVDEWSPTDWACAMAGEAGEVCNKVKKIRRLANGDQPYNKQTEPELRAAVAHELADVVIYSDLLAARLGIDLGDAVVAKFNLTSVEIGSPLRLKNDSNIGQMLAARAEVTEIALTPAKVYEERRRQDEQWGGPAHDDAHDLTDFLGIISNQNGKAWGELVNSAHATAQIDHLESRFVKIAAVAIAALESIDRRRKQISKQAA